MEEIFLLLPVVVSIAMMVALTVAHVLYQHPGKRVQAERVAEPFSVLAIALAFDPDHALLWETQVPVLQLISSAGPHGVGIRRLYAWHLTFARHYPELCDGFTFWQWLEFLEEVQLVARHGCRVVLTSQGSSFLQYRLTAQTGMAVAPEANNSNER